MGLCLLCLAVALGAEPLLALWWLQMGVASPSPSQTPVEPTSRLSLIVVSAIHPPLGSLGLAHGAVDVKEARCRPLVGGKALSGACGHNRTLRQPTLACFPDRGQQCLTGIVRHEGLTISGQ